MKFILTFKRPLFGLLISAVLAILFINSCSPSDRSADIAELHAEGLSQIVGGFAKQAIGTYDKIIRLDPGNADAYQMRGFVIGIIEGDPIRAISDYNKAIELNPKAIYYSQRGDIHRRIDDTKDRSLGTDHGVAAIADYSKAIEINPDPKDNGQAYQRRAIARFLHLPSPDLPGAILDLNKSIEYNQKNYATFEMRGMLRIRTGDYRLAESDLSQSISLNSTNPDAYFFRGTARLIMGNIDGALSDLYKTLEIDPNHEEALEALSYVEK